MTRITSAVQVDEHRLWFEGNPAWWISFKERFMGTDRLRVESTSAGGDVVLVGMDGVNHALEWMEVAEVNGIPAAAMKLRGMP